MRDLRRTVPETDLAMKPRVPNTPGFLASPSSQKRSPRIVNLSLTKVKPLDEHLRLRDDQLIRGTVDAVRRLWSPERAPRLPVKGLCPPEFDTRARARGQERRTQRNGRRKDTKIDITKLKRGSQGTKIAREKEGGGKARERVQEIEDSRGRETRIRESSHSSPPVGLLSRSDPSLSLPLAAPALLLVKIDPLPARTAAVHVERLGIAARRSNFTFLTLASAGNCQREPPRGTTCRRLIGQRNVLPLSLLSIKKKKNSTTLERSPRMETGGLTMSDPFQ